jgi:hypothetical protein
VHEESPHWFDGIEVARPDTAYSGVAQEIWERISGEGRSSWLMKIQKQMTADPGVRVRN